MSTMHSYVKLIRPINCTMGGLGVFIGAFVCVGFSIYQYLPMVALAVIIVFIFMGGANALNDYFDIKTDTINHPERPIPSGKIKRKTALQFSVGALTISIVLSVFINLTSFLIVCVAVLLIILYEVQYKHKGLIGNINISLLVALLFIFGGSVVLQYNLNIILAGMAFFATLGREIVKDIEDIKGDVDRFTLPKKIGIRSAGQTAAAMLIIAIIISPLPYFPEYIPIITIPQVINYQYLIIILMADIVFINSITEIVNNPKRSSQLLKLGMAIALIAFLAAAIS